MSQNKAPGLPEPKNKRSNKRIAEKYLQQRKQLWPDITDQDLWLRKQRDGFTTIPRTMPLVACIIDDMSNGKPVFSTYFDLWCRAFDECFVILRNKQEMAFYAGFQAQRGEDTWKARMKILAELGFIQIKAGPYGELSYALIMNPHKIIHGHHKKKTPTLEEAHYSTLLTRLVEIGANDISSG